MRHDEVIAEFPLARDLEFHYRGALFVRVKGSQWDRTFEIVYRPYSGGVFVLDLNSDEAHRLKEVFDSPDHGIGETEHV